MKSCIWGKNIKIKIILITGFLLITISDLSGCLENEDDNRLQGRWEMQGENNYLMPESLYFYKEWMFVNKCKVKFYLGLIRNGDYKLEGNHLIITLEGEYKDTLELGYEFKDDNTLNLTLSDVDGDITKTYYHTRLTG